MRKKRKKNSLMFFNKIRNIIYSNKFREQNRNSNRDFTRQRKLPFPKLILFMLNIVKQSLQKELTQFYLNFSKEKNITNSAFCQSRMKLNYTAFIELNNTIIKEFYTDNNFKLWKGFRLLGIDGSKMQLPLTLEMIESFGYAQNSSNTIIPMAQTSFCLDLLNKMIINAELDRYETSEYNLALKSIEKCNLKDLLIYDRGYDAIWFMLFHQIKKKDFIIRMRRNSIKEIEDFFYSNEKSNILEINELHENSDKQIKRLGIKFESFKIRLVKVFLKNNEVEVLATSLLDKEKYPDEEFKWLYSQRWGIETEFDHLKNNLMIENFTGLSKLSIAQDFLQMHLLQICSKL